MDVDDPTSPITPHKPGRKARASSDLARNKHFARKQVLKRSSSLGTRSDNVPDFEFSFTPPVLLGYSDVPRRRVSPKIWSSLSASLTLTRTKYQSSYMTTSPILGTCRFEMSNAVLAVSPVINSILVHADPDTNKIIRSNEPYPKKLVTVAFDNPSALLGLRS
jgi:hypothetical protein